MRSSVTFVVWKVLGCEEELIWDRMFGFVLSPLRLGEPGRRAGVFPRGHGVVPVRRNSVVVCELKLKGIEKPMVATGLLADLAGELVLPRSGFMRVISEYAKENGLKEGGNKIRCDAKLKKLFNGLDTITLFGANKYFGQYLMDPVEMGPDAVKKAEAYEKEYFKKKAEEGSPTTSSKKKPAKKKGPPNNALMKPVKVSKELAAICEKDELARPHITKAIWAYAKKHSLQNGRMIKCDEKLKKVMDGQDEVDGFRMVKLLQPHILKK